MSDLTAEVPPAQPPSENASIEAAQPSPSPAEGVVPTPPSLAEAGPPPAGIDVPPPPRFGRTEPHKVSAKELCAGENASFWREVEAAARIEPDPDQVRDLAQRLATASQDENTPLLLFDASRAERGEPFVRVEDEKGAGRFWIVGDLHGDVLGLETVLHYRRAHFRNDPCSVVFLGDLFDRGEHGPAVLYCVLKLIADEPGQHGFIVGNHDVGLRYDGDRFSSDVQPSEFADWLNVEPPDSAWRRLAEVAVRFFEYAPRVVLLPDGLLIAHGGVPHVDRQSQIGNRVDLNKPDMQMDFVWTRLHESAKRKIPNRTTRGCSLGVSDFDAFCAQMNRIGLPVKGMVRGHDHLEARYAFFEKYERHPVLTINTMCYRQAGETFGEFHRPAVVAARSPGAMPEVHVLEVPLELIEKFYDAEVSPAS